MSVPYPPPGQAVGNVITLSPDAVRKSQSLKFWLKFFGIFSMIAGGIYCLSLVGIIIGWLPILMGWWMFKAGDELDHFAKTSQVDRLEAFIGNLRNLYLTMGILTIIQFAFMIIMGIVYVIAGAALVAAMQNGGGF